MTPEIITAHILESYSRRDALYFLRTWIQDSNIGTCSKAALLASVSVLERDET